MRADPPFARPFNLAAHALRHTARLADKPALEIVRQDGALVYSYGALEAEVRGTGTGFLALGLRPGARILLRLGNTLAFPTAFLGAIAAGLVPMPTAAGLTEAEITRMAEKVGPDLIVAEPGIALPQGQTPVLGLSDLQVMANLPPCAWDMGDAGRLAYIVFTSGTSGQSLPVAHAHRAILARQMMHEDWQGMGESDRVLHAGALNWTYTLGAGLLDPWALGATALIPEAGCKPGDIAALLLRHGATIVAAAPGVYRQMLKAPLPALPALPDLRHGLSAGEALPAALRQAWRQATGTDLHEAMGMTECSTFLSGGPRRPAPLGYSGYAQTGRSLAVLSAEGVPLPAGEAGILGVARDDPGLMLGYLGQPVETAARFKGTWFMTSDLVEQAQDGAFRHLGRADDIMNPGGFRVAPQEVEAAFDGFPGLIDLAVAEVELRPGLRVVGCGYVAAQVLDPAALAEFGARTLAGYKVPRLWHLLDHLPRNANNKLNRRALGQTLQSLEQKEPT